MNLAFRFYLDGEKSVGVKITPKKVFFYYTATDYNNYRNYLLKKIKKIITYGNYYNDNITLRPAWFCHIPTMAKEVKFVFVKYGSIEELPLAEKIRKKIPCVDTYDKTTIEPAMKLAHKLWG